MRHTTGYLFGEEGREKGAGLCFLFSGAFSELEESGNAESLLSTEKENTNKL